MDKIYEHRYTKITDVKAASDLYRKNLGYANTVKNTDLSDMEQIKAAMKYQGTNEEFAELNASIDIELLAHPDDIRAKAIGANSITAQNNKRSICIPKAAIQLKTIENLIEQRTSHHVTYKKRIIKHNKYKAIKRTINNTAADIGIYAETIISVRVYEPFRYKAGASVIMKPKLSQQFNVLGSQLLSELRDKIRCQCDYGPFMDISNNPNQVFVPPTPKNRNNNKNNDNNIDDGDVDDDNDDDEDDVADNGDDNNDNNHAPVKKFDNGFFFINDTFYNDTRQQPIIDYSKVIREWASRQHEIDQLKVDKMETTYFHDLSIRLGAANCYQHNGNCEHLFTFSDCRLIGLNDSRNRKDYPMLTMISRTKCLFCMTCGQSESRFVVRNSALHIYDPTYLCGPCFESFHYINGEKVGEFQAYRYVSNPTGEGA